VIGTYIQNTRLNCEVTLDVDTQLIEVYKADAKICYDSYKALQAMKVCWAETMLVMEDKYREGNVFPALPEEYANAHPKRLRFAIFTMIGRVISHSSQMLLRIASEVLATIIAPARKRIALLINCGFSPLIVV
jgi:hypothetical protein